MAFYFCFTLGGSLDFLDFLQKSFITSTTDLKQFEQGSEITYQ